MLVHLVELKGSGPREVGRADAGHRARHRRHDRRRRARAHRDPEGARAAPFRRGRALAPALGPELNQCCGGSVTIAFEPFAPADLAWLKKLVRAADEPTPVFRTVRSTTRAGSGATGCDGTGERAGLRCERSPASRADHPRARSTRSAQAFWLFGAGHVGRAVAKRSRRSASPSPGSTGAPASSPSRAPAGVRCLALAMPELAVDEAPPDTIFLVMTHSHPLDEAICEAVLRRDDFAYLGLIGSATKRARFVKRLGEAGIRARAARRGSSARSGFPASGARSRRRSPPPFAADLLDPPRAEPASRRSGRVAHGR